MQKAQRRAALGISLRHSGHGRTVSSTGGSVFRREGSALVFDRPLAREGRLGFWRWLSLFLGVAGTYRQNDTVDVVYELGGRRQVETGLRFEALE